MCFIELCHYRYLVFFQRHLMFSGKSYFNVNTTRCLSWKNMVRINWKALENYFHCLYLLPCYYIFVFKLNSYSVSFQALGLLNYLIQALINQQNRTYTKNQDKHCSVVDYFGQLWPTDYISQSKNQKLAYCNLLIKFSTRFLHLISIVRAIPFKVVLFVRLLSSFQIINAELSTTKLFE